MQTGGDLTREELEEIEAHVSAALRSLNLEEDEPPDLNIAVRAWTGGDVQIAPMRTLARTETRNRTRRIQLRMDVIDTPRGRELVGHELGHEYVRRFLRRDVSEAWCDSFGVMIAAPTRCVRRAIDHFGRRVHSLASALQIEQEAALLRYGEATGRPVALERRPKRLVLRGDDYPWPPVKAVLASRDRSVVHPITVGRRVGLMLAA